jgi:hypothetical protein
MITAQEAKRLNNEAQRRQDFEDLSEIEDMIIVNAKKTYCSIELRTLCYSDYVYNVLIENGFKLNKNSRTTTISW